MTSNHHAPYDLGYTRATMVSDKGKQTREGEQTGLDTLVVHAVNDEYQVSGGHKTSGAVANALSIPPGEYVRKNETHRN